MIRLSRSPTEAVIIGKEAARQYKVPLKVAVKIIEQHSKNTEEQLRKAMVVWSLIKQTKEVDVQ